MEALTTLTIALAAASALLSAVSTIAAWRATKAVQRELVHTISAKKHELVRTFEQDYASQYEQIWANLGPWPDTAPVDPQLRHTVHNLLQTLTSVYLALKSSLIEAGQAEALYTIMFDWLSTDKAFQVWNAAFRAQPDTWPSGFVSFVDSRLVSRRGLSQEANNEVKIAVPTATHRRVNIGELTGFSHLGRPTKMEKRERLQHKLEEDLAPVRAELWSVPLLRDPPEATTQAALLVAHELQRYTSIFPRCLGALVSQSDDDAARAVLVENLWEEHGSGNLTRSHRVLFENFFESLKRHSPAIAAPNFWLESTTEAAESLLRVAASGFIRGLGALAVGVEADTVAQFAVMHSYFSKLPDGQDLNYEFFTLHEASDDAHADAMLDVLAAYVIDNETYVLALDGASSAIAADLMFWSGVDAGVERMHSTR